MRKVKFRDWEFEVNLELTHKAFENELNGSADTCDCGYCLNFRQQREKIFPKEIKDLFENLGIDFKKEEYICEIDQLENGLFSYTGHFHFAGKILSGATFNSEEYSGIELLQISENFLVSFGEKQGKQWVKVLFEVNLPWIIDEAENFSFSDFKPAWTKQ